MTVAQHPNRFVAHPARRVRGVLTVPGDKSISHRAVMLGADRRGTNDGSRLSRRRRLRRDAPCARGARRPDTHRRRTVSSRSTVSGRAACERRRRCWTSATRARRFGCWPGLLAGQPFDIELTGDASLRSRPMERVAAPLRRMGAQNRDDATASRRSTSAAAPAAEASTTACRWPARKSSPRCCSRGSMPKASRRVRSPGPTRDHTERMLMAMGVPLTVADEGLTVSFKGPARLAGRRYRRSRRLFVRGVLARGGMPGAPTTCSRSVTSASTRPAPGCSTSCARWAHGSSSRTSGCSARSPWPTCSSVARHCAASTCLRSGCRLRSTSSPCYSSPRLAAHGNDDRARRRGAAPQGDRPLGGHGTSARGARRGRRGRRRDGLAIEVGIL